MKKLNLIKFYTLALIALFGLALNSCSTDANNSEEIEISEFEVQKVLAIDDYSGIADNAIAAAFMAKDGTAKKGFTQKNNECYSTTYTDTGFSMTFNNCVLNTTDKVNGSLEIIYAINETSSTFTTTYSAFYVGTIRLDGTRTFTITTSETENEVAFTVASDMVITLEDGEVITEAGTKTTSLVFTNDSIEVIVSGTWALVENGDTYNITVTEELRKLIGCEYFTEGTFILSKNGLEVIVDLGDGTCDNKAEIIYPNGKIEEITL
jgi:hypothetical protein